MDTVFVFNEDKSKLLDVYTALSNVQFSDTILVYDDGVESSLDPWSGVFGLYGVNKNNVVTNYYNKGFLEYDTPNM